MNDNEHHLGEESKEGEHQINFRDPNKDHEDPLVEEHEEIAGG